MKKITFDEERCRGCEFCIIACPKKIIKFDTAKINKKGYHPASVGDMESCSACAFCAVTCPHVVITVEK